jgi:hypothetical protein
MSFHFIQDTVSGYKLENRPVVQWLSCLPQVADQTKDYKIGMCCFLTKHTALRSKNKDWLFRSQDIVFEWNDTSTCTRTVVSVS